MRLKVLERFDYILLACVIVLSVFGVAFIYSAGINSDGVLVTNEYVKQITWGCVGLAVMVVVALLDYRRYKRYARYGYAALLAILVYTARFGKLVNGARSWIGISNLGIQPAELGKILFVLSLAAYLEATPKSNPRWRFITALSIMLLPMGLILLQPDLGTSTVYLPIFLFMGFMAGIRLHYLLMVLLTGMLTILLTVLPIWQSEIAHTEFALINILNNDKLILMLAASAAIIASIGLLGQVLFRQRYYYWITYVFGIIMVALLLSLIAKRVLQAYQIQRLIIFLDPESDPQGAGWNIRQSIIAIGSGGLRGRGFKMGTQSHYHFLPEQSTDFIFSILSEEAGFFGCMVVYAAFLIILLRTVAITRAATNRFGYLISSGLLGMYFYHFVVNVGMVMGIMPVTGIPLPFLSYGGSAYLTNILAIGLLMSVRSRRLDFNAEVV